MFLISHQSEFINIYGHHIDRLRCPPAVCQHLVCCSGHQSFDQWDEEGRGTRQCTELHCPHELVGTRVKVVAAVSTTSCLCCQQGDKDVEDQWPKLRELLLTSPGAQNHFNWAHECMMNKQQLYYLYIYYLKVIKSIIKTQPFITIKTEINQNILYLHFQLNLSQWVRS